MTRTNYAPNCTCSYTGKDDCDLCGPHAGNFDFDCATCGERVDGDDAYFEDEQGLRHCMRCAEEVYDVKEAA